MSDINHVVLTGRIGRDPETKFFESGAVLMNFSIAVNKWDKRESKEVANWIDIKLWLKQTQMTYYSSYAVKGAQVTVSGSLDVESWEKDGQKRSKVVVLARDVIIPKQSGTTAEPGNVPADVPF